MRGREKRGDWESSGGGTKERRVKREKGSEERRGAECCKG